MRFPRIYLLESVTKKVDFELTLQALRGRSASCNWNLSISKEQGRIQLQTSMPLGSTSELLFTRESLRTGSSRSQLTTGDQGMSSGG
jgi:hypothetical protein